MASELASDISSTPLNGRLDSQRHPRGLYVLFATEMWERFSFYTMLAMFTLYLQDEREGFSWTSAQATSLYANYLMFVYASPLIGGIIADRKLGYRRSVMLGGLFFMAGHLLLSFRSISIVYAALACLVIGNGFFKPNVSTMVGNLYPEGSHLKDRAYNIFYMGINIGAFFAPVIAEIVQAKYGFHVAFAVAAFGMLISVSILWYFRSLVEDPQRIGKPASHHPATVSSNRIDSVSDGKRIAALIVIFLIVIVFWMVFHQNGSTITYWANDNTDWEVSGIISNAINPFYVVTLTFPLVWLWQWLDKRGKEPSTPAKMAMGMFLTGASFFILYAAAKQGEAKTLQPGDVSTASYRINERVIEDLRADGVPATILEQLETAETDGRSLVLGRKFSTDRTHAEALASIKTELQLQGVAGTDWELINDAAITDGPMTDGSFSTALSTTIGELEASGLPPSLVQRLRAYSSASFTSDAKLQRALTQAIGRDAAAAHRDTVLGNAFIFRVSPFWLLLSYAVVTLGELLLSPMGLSLVSKVAPIRMRGMMMGGWFVATAIGNKLTMIGVYWDVWRQSYFFAVLGGMALFMAIVLFLLLRPLKRAMPGV
jgi:POT family proton-dependent oligopeptide transporter